MYLYKDDMSKILGKVQRNYMDGMKRISKEISQLDPSDERQAGKREGLLQAQLIMLAAMGQ